MILIGFTEWEKKGKDGKSYKHAKGYFVEPVKAGYGEGQKVVLSAEFDLDRIKLSDLAIGCDYCVQTRTYERAGFTFTVIDDIR